MDCGLSVAHVSPGDCDGSDACGAVLDLLDGDGDGDASFVGLEGVVAVEEGRARGASVGADVGAAVTTLVRVDADADADTGDTITIWPDTRNRSGTVWEEEAVWEAEAVRCARVASEGVGAPRTWASGESGNDRRTRGLLSRISVGKDVEEEEEEEEEKEEDSRAGDTTWLMGWAGVFDGEASAMTGWIG
jgi:hypothetical protein